MSTGDYLVGVAFFLATLVPAVATGIILTRKRFAYLCPLPRVLAAVTIATGALVFATVMPAAVGILTRGTVAAASLLLLGVTWRLRSAPARSQPAPRPPPSGRVSVLIATAALGAALVYELARLRFLISQPITNIDMLAFHLPGVARFIQTGTLWQVNQFLPGFATAQYPNNGDLIILSTVLPWHDFAFARFPALFFYGLTGVAIYALALELGATRAAAVTFAAMGLVVPAFSNVTLDGLPDAITVSLLAIGVMFALRHARHGRCGEPVLAAAALGLALGTKWFGLTDAAVLVLVWLLARRIARVPGRQLARDAGVAIAVMFAAGGVWLVRNLVESANPIYPKAVSLFGVQLFAGSHHDVIDQFGYTVFDYLGSPGILRKYLYPSFKVELGIAGIVLLAGTLWAVLRGVSRLLRRAEGPDRARLHARSDTLHTAALLAVAVAALGFCLIYAATPGSAYGPKNLPLEGGVNIRWLSPALALGGAICAALASAIGRWGAPLELAGLVGVLSGIDLGPSVPGSTLVKVGAITVVIAAGTLLIRRRPSIGRRIPRRSARSAGMVLAALLAITALGRADERSFDRHFYDGYDPVLAWLGAHAPSGQRIGFTGGVGTNATADILPAFGPRLGNQVSYVGDVVRHSVAVPTRLADFRSELAAGHNDLLLVQLRYAGQTETWTRQLGYRLLDRSGALALYQAPNDPRALKR